jgi:hypothetical protein
MKNRPTKGSSTTDDVDKRIKNQPTKGNQSPMTNLTVQRMTWING